MKIALLLFAVFVALAAGVQQAFAQRDVADPLEDFLSMAAPDGAKRTPAGGVSRVIGDFNNDGRPDIALWQAADFGPQSGEVYLYLGRKDGRFTMSGTIIVSAVSLFKAVPVEKGIARLLVCAHGRGDETIASGYSLEETIVNNLPKDESPKRCTASNRSERICREACADESLPLVEQLDVERYRTAGFEAWIRHR